MEILKMKKSDNLILSILNEKDEIIRTEEITLSDIEIEQIGTDERQMGAEICYRLSYTTGETEVECEVYEYPIGVYNYKSDWRSKTGRIRVEKDNLDYQDFIVEKQA